MLTMPQEECQRRGLTQLTNTIGQIQLAEKEKLTLTAAVHLDRMRGELSSLAEVAGQVDQLQVNYLADKLNASKKLLADLMEEVQSIKIDLLEEE